MLAPITPLAVPKGSRLDGNRLYRARYGSAALIDLARSICELASAEGIGSVELAYQWLFERPGVDRVLIGPGSVAHLDAALDCVALQLPEGARRKVDALVREFEGTDARYAR